MKKVKKLSALFLAMVMLFALVACGADPAADAGNEAENTNPDAENLVIKMGHAESDNENSCHHMADTKFAELVNEYSDGRITIEVFANGQLGGERDMVEGLQIGTVDMCSVANLSLSGFDESFGVFDLPYFFDTAEDAYKILDSEYFNDVMCPALAEKTGIRILGVGVGGYRNIACNKTITSIDDFNSLKIRVPQNSLYVDAYDALGFQTTTMAISEVVAGLQQGTVDGFEMMITPLYTNGFYDLLDHCCLTQINFSVNPMLISETLFQSLSTEDQEILMRAAREAAVYEREKIAAFTDECVKLLEEKGMSFDTIDLVPCKEAVASVIDKYADSIGADVTLVEENATISGMLDATPFLAYFIENVYHKLNGVLPTAQTTEAFQTALSHGQVTEKEKALWEFVLSAYGDAEFSTKQLEKDFGNAAYATIRSFVLKFEKLGLLKSTQYGNRVKYAVRVC